MSSRASYAGTLALAGALSVMAISPALAASPNESLAAVATGPISAPPAGVASFPGETPVTLTDADITGLLTTGGVTDTADAVAASSTVKRATASLTALITLSAASVSSSCGFDANTDAVTGSTMITGGALDLPKSALALGPTPAPNTTVAGLGDAATVTLNAQSTASDGRLTVTAIQISIPGSAQTLSLGVSTCNTAQLEPVPFLPGKSAMAALAVAALALAGAALGVRRHRLQSKGAPPPCWRGRALSRGSGPVTRRGPGPGWRSWAGSRLLARSGAGARSRTATAPASPRRRRRQ